MEFCKYEMVDVRPTKKTKSGKSRKNYSRRSCKRTSNQNLNSSKCTIGLSGECVLKGRDKLDTEKLEAKRAKSRIKYRFKNKNSNNKFKDSFIIGYEFFNDTDYDQYWSGEAVDYLVDNFPYPDMTVKSIMIPITKNKNYILRFKYPTIVEGAIYNLDNWLSSPVDYEMMDYLIKSGELPKGKYNINRDLLLNRDKISKILLSGIEHNQIIVLTDEFYDQHNVLPLY
jgi:hypothetical protein